MYPFHSSVARRQRLTEGGLKRGADATRGIFLLEDAHCHRSCRF